MAMQYRRLGQTGLQVSVLSFGAFVTFGPQLRDSGARDCLAAAFERGVNFFDTAETYGNGESERIMGKAIVELGWPRHSYVISTKLFFGIHDVPNMQRTLNRKYLLHATDGSLERLGLDFVDVLFCHRHDPNTPLEETVRAMSDLVSAGKALYWGTSEWPAAEIRAAWDIAERHHLHKPVVEQPQYNLLHRARVEVEYADLYTEIGLGLTTWSPLAGGLLTGKYLNGMPPGSRAALPGSEWTRDFLVDELNNKRAQSLMDVAAELGCTSGQLAIAWCAYNPHVSTVLTGASRVEQLEENLASLDLLDQFDDGVVKRIEAAIGRADLP